MRLKQIFTIESEVVSPNLEEGIIECTLTPYKLRSLLETYIPEGMPYKISQSEDFTLELDS